MGAGCSVNPIVIRKVDPSPPLLRLPAGLYGISDILSLKTVTLADVLPSAGDILIRTVSRELLDDGSALLNLGF